MALTVGTWNINSIRARLDSFFLWVDKHDPDIILLQETKCVEEYFPELLRENYNVAICGQKSYNGCVILSRFPIESIQTQLLGTDDEEARYVQGTIKTDSGVFTLASVYVPNGRAVDSEHYTYKLEFMDSLYKRMQELLPEKENVIVAGDFNIAPNANDIHEKWDSELFCSQKERDAFEKLIQENYSATGQKTGYTWWDYRNQSFENNFGLRLDHILLSKPLATKKHRVIVDKWVRALKRPSDHAPLRIVFE